MKEYPTPDVRNVCIVGHTGAGKTSVGEGLLFDAGATDRLGTVQGGTTVLDHEPDAVKRQITLSLASAFCEWRKTRISLLDTPGDANFIPESQAAMGVADGVLVVANTSAGGIEIQMERLWRHAVELGQARVVFANKIDHERAGFHPLVAVMRASFGGQIVPITLPLGEGAEFHGIVDLLHERTLTFSGEGVPKVVASQVPDSMADLVAEHREKLIEAAAEGDDELLEKFLEGQTLSIEEIQRGLRAATLRGAVVPVLAGSATRNIGLQPLLDSLVAYLPSPADLPPREGLIPATGEKATRAAQPDGPFSAFVFKTVADPYAGRLTLFRVVSGSVSSDSNVYNASKKERERVGQLYFLQGKNLVPVEKAKAGDLAAVAKLKVTGTSDTLCDEKDPIVFEPLHWPAPVISFAAVPKSRGDEEKMSSALARLKEEDLTLRVERDPQTRELLIGGMGELHLEVMVDRLKRKFGVEVEVRTPRVPYKETIRGNAKAQGKYKKQTGGRGQYGDAWVEVEPLPRGGGFEFVDRIVGGVIPRGYIPAVEKGIQEALDGGVLAGYPVVDMKVTLYDGSYHTVDSSEMAFKIAGSLAFKKAVKEAQPILLEPIMNLEVIVPEEFMGDVIGDLNSRRGKVLGMEPGGNSPLIRIEVPMAEVLRYSSILRSLTGGRGTSTMKFSRYEEVPAHIAEQVVAQSRAE